ncbi:hypothetical protein BGZ76_000281 [Entomortierella beljakovae]|nr:hypothetical protein BGZ76_000281 [Entomortierella beljakovae]
MPPKRKTAGTISETPAKVAKTTGSRAKATKKGTTAKKVVPSIDEKQFDPERCYTWFKTFTDLEDEDFDKDQIGPAGISKLCEDINVSLEAIDMLVLAYHLKADTMPIFTKNEWLEGMKILEVDSTEKLKKKMPELVAKTKNPQQFREFYRYIFMFAKDSGQKCMPVETACAMIQTAMDGKPHEKRFVEFLERDPAPVKVINKDQWHNFLDFSDTVAEDLSNYDGASSAWPVLLDDYVEWRNSESS